MTAVHGIPASVAGQPPLDAAVYRMHFELSAASSGTVVERHFLIAGRSVTLRFAGSRLVSETCRALSHLRVPHAWEHPDLLVGLWDSASTGVPALLDEPAVATGETAGPWTVVRSGDLQVGHRADRTWVSALDATAGVAWHWVRDPKHIQEWDRAAPLRALLHWWLSDSGIHLLHGGAVGRGGTGVLLVGAGGSGKSTATLACAGAGMDYLGDDFVAAAAGHPPTVHSLYSSAKLEPHHLQRFPSLLPGVAVPAEGRRPPKVVAYLDEVLPGRPRARFDLACVLVPRVEERVGSTVEPTSRAEVLQALAPSSLFLLPGAARQSTLTELASIVAAVPSFRLRVGHDLAGIAEAVDHAMEVVA